MKTKGLLSVPGAMGNVSVQHKVTTLPKKPFNYNGNIPKQHSSTRMTVKPSRFGLLCVDLERTK
jgi:hypothetical protein